MLSMFVGVNVAACAACACACVCTCTACVRTLLCAYGLFVRLCHALILVFLSMQQQPDEPVISVSPPPSDDTPPAPPSMMIRAVKKVLHTSKQAAEKRVTVNAAKKCVHTSVLCGSGSQLRMKIRIINWLLVEA